MHAEIVQDVQDLPTLVQERLADGRLRAVVAAGGDGTARLVAERTPPGTPLAILPLGTENLLAGYLEASSNAQSLATTIANGRIVQLDAAQGNGRLFALMAGCGFDADVVRRLHRQRRGHIHRFSYVKPIFESIRNYDYPPLRIHYEVRQPRQETGAPIGVEGNQQVMTEGDITARWAFVVNLPRYAGGLNFAPAASGCDGLLDVCTFRGGSLWNALWYLGGVLIGQHEQMDGFSLVRCTRLRIESDGPVPYQLDGDPGGELPLDIEVLPGRLTLLVSPAWKIEGQRADRARVTA